MKHLRTQWKQAERRLLRASQLLLLFDFDGTLAPIVVRPGDARMLPACAAALARLAAVPGCTLGFLSGRSLIELERLVSMPGCFYSGNAGLEWEGPGRGPFRFTPPAEVRGAIRLASEMFASVISLFPGATIEDKGLAFTVHFRGIAEHRLNALREQLADVCARLPEEVVATEGKMALEVRPASASDKGKVLRAIVRAVERRTRKAPLVFYFGDEPCDEPAFAALPSGGYAVHVGEPDGPSAAHFYLQDPAELALFLERTAALLESRAMAAAYQPGTGVQPSYA